MIITMRVMIIIMFRVIIIFMIRVILIIMIRVILISTGTWWRPEQENIGKCLLLEDTGNHHYQHYLPDYQTIPLRLLQRKCVVLSPFQYVIAMIPFYSLTIILARIRAIGPAGRRGEWTEVRSHHWYFKCSSLVLLLVVVIWSLVYCFLSTKLWFLIHWTLRKTAWWRFYMFSPRLAWSQGEARELTCFFENLAAKTNKNIEWL